LWLPKLENAVYQNFKWNTLLFSNQSPVSEKTKKKNKKTPPKTKQTKYKTFSPPPGEGRNMGHGWEQ